MRLIGYVAAVLATTWLLAMAAEAAWNFWWRRASVRPGGYWLRRRREAWEKGWEDVARDRALALALAGEGVEPAEASRLFLLWRGDFRAECDGGGLYLVVGPDGRTVSELVAERLAARRRDADPAPEPYGGRLDLTPGQAPKVKGAEVPVSAVVALVVDGWTWAAILGAYRDLTEDDIRACLAYTVEQDRAEDQS